MKIAFEMQPLLDDEKTGIGFYADNLVRRVITQNPETDFILECFLFKDIDVKKETIYSYNKSNTTTQICRFPRFFYRMLSTFLPIPYRWFFRNDAYVRHFFNYITPPFAGGKKVVTIHDLSFIRFPETLSFKTKMLLRLGLRRSIARADVVLTISEFSRREILHFYPCLSEKVRVLYIGVDYDKFHVNITEKEKERICNKYGITKPYILYLGTLEPRKNIERLIEAYALLRQKQLDVPPLVLAGKKGWLYEGIFNKLISFGLQEFVRFTGYVDEEDKAALLAGAIYFCFPSLYEGFGMPPLEAMACGTPVLAADAASLPEVLGDAALLVDPFSADDIAKGMEQLLTDAQLRTELKRKGIIQAAKFDWDTISKELYQLYQSLEDGL